MGENERHRREQRLIDAENMREQEQLRIDGEKSIEDRRKCGQFATPFSLAGEIVVCGLELLHEKEISFLEPSLGTGALFSSLLREASTRGKAVKRATGVEKDPAYADSAQSIWQEDGLHVYKADFTCLAPDGQYNFLIANPPYVRHHCIPQEEKVRLAECTWQETGIRVSGLAGLYCYFILLAQKWLAPGAVCGWLVPSEFMDVNYGAAVKEYLLDKVHLLRIHRYSPARSKFDDALVSSCVVWYKNEFLDGDYDIEFSFGGTHTDPLQRRTIRRSALRAEGKWTRFPSREIRSTGTAAATIGDFFSIKRGIVTGDNDFFILTKEKIQTLGLDMTSFTPILPSPRNLKTDCVEADKSGNLKLEPQYFLLNCRLTESEVRSKCPALWEYLQSGIPKTSNRYLCRKRKAWYWQEQRQPTRFVCTYMGRGTAGGPPIRFVLNLSDAIAPNSYLMLYPKGQLQQVIANNPDIVYQIWQGLKAISADEIEREGRIYGGGLRKVEPNELAKVACDGLRAVCETA